MYAGRYHQNRMHPVMFLYVLEFHHQKRMYNWLSNHHWDQQHLLPVIQPGLNNLQESYEFQYYHQQIDPQLTQIIMYNPW